jgi:hypothetical protein
MIRKAGNVSLAVWRRWIEKELTPPLEERVANYPQVRKVLESFKDLIEQAELQNVREIRAQSGNLDLEEVVLKVLDTKR